MNTLIRFVRTWKLPVAMVIGALLYFLIETLMPSPEQSGRLFYAVSHYVQPLLIFCMLMLSFLKVSWRDMRPHRWHAAVLLMQGSLFVLFSLLAYASRTLLPSHQSLLVLLEGTMLCFICPTATASAVIVQKLGGSLSGCVTYLILCNLMVSLLAPGFLTLVEPHAELDFLTSLFLIMGKVFPLLLCPLLLAMVVRHYMHWLTRRLLAIRDLAFYLWLVALAFAIMVTVRTIVETHIGLTTLLGLSLVSMICCCMQFWLGRKAGLRYAAEATRSRDSITAGQAFGQKNTVFVIWMGLVFLNPVTSVVGGFYSVWHNIINSWQLRKSQSKPSATAGRPQQ